MEQVARRLTRSRRDRVFAGVCGGLADYLAVDPVLVRVLYVALTLLSWGTGIVLYLLAWIMIPLEAEGVERSVRAQDRPSRRGARRIAGILLVIVGLVALLTASFGWFSVFSIMRLAGPVLLLAGGLILLLWHGESEPLSASAPISLETKTATRDTSDGTERAEPRRLTRQWDGHKIAGVCAGLGTYLNLDPTIIRLIFIALLLAGGAGLVLYVIMWIVVPLQRDVPAVQLKA